MSFPNQSSLRGTIQQLKEIVFSLQGEDHESARLVQQMEALVVEIERKTKQSNRSVQSSSQIGQVAIKGSPAQATV